MGLLVALVLASRDAVAAASVRLAYVLGAGAEQCPGEHVVREAVSRRLRYNPFSAGARDTLSVEITHDGGAFFAHASLVDEANKQRGGRDIKEDGNDCVALIEALALTISLIIEPIIVDDDARHPPHRESTQDHQPARSNVSADALQLHLGVGALGSVGSGPAPSLGGIASAGVRWRAVSLDLEGRADLPTTGASDVLPARVRTSLLALSAVPCLHIENLYGCAVASGGEFSAVVVDVAAPRKDDAAWFAAGGRAGIEIGLSRTLRLRGYGELFRTFTRHTLVIDAAPVYTVTPLSGGIGMSVAMRLL